MALSESQIFSPSQKQVGEPAPRLSPNEILEKLTECDNSTGEVSRLYGQWVQFKTRVLKLIADNTVQRIGQLQSELEQVCEQGRRQQQVFINAKNNEVMVRNEDLQRNNAHALASRELNNAVNATLPAFYSNRDAERKLERIAAAQVRLDAILADMNANPLAVPRAVNAKQQAELALSDLQARERSIRREIAALTGEQSHSVGTSASDVGLA